MFGDTNQSNPVSSPSLGEAGGSFVNNSQIVFGNAEFGASSATTSPETTQRTSTSAAASAGGAEALPADLGGSITSPTISSSGTNVWLIVGLIALLAVGGFIVIREFNKKEK